MEEQSPESLFSGTRATLEALIGDAVMQCFVILFFALCAVVGSCFGFQTTAEAGSEKVQLIAQKSTAVQEEEVKQPLDRFEDDIKAFEARDRSNPPKPGGTVFVGSSSFTKWTSLETEFSKFNAINRGFGGSTFPDVNNYVKRIVTNYKPKKIVVYAGTNDIGELHHHAPQILKDFQDFVSKVRKDLPDADIYFISMSMAPSRIKWAADFDKGNALVSDYIKTGKHLHYIDVVPVMRNKNGKLRTELFGPDNLHMTAEGYAAWTPIIEKALRSSQ